MACNIIMNNAGELRTTQFTFTTIYDIGDINFYIPTSKANSCQVFLVLKNSKNLREIVELVRSKNDTQTSANSLYKISTDSFIRIGNDTVEIYLLIIHRETGEYFTSTTLSIKLSSEKYKLARQVRIAEEISQKVQEYYAKILILSEANQEIYKKIEEGVTQ